MKRRVSEVALALLLTSVFGLVFYVQPVKASGTIYIMPDGSVDPSTAPISTLDNITYTFTNDICVDANESIRVERSNITIDGDGYLLQSPGYARALGFLLYGPLHGTSNVTIKNTNVKGFYIGVCIDKSLNNSISGNDITNNTYGIYLGNSNYTKIFENNMTQNGCGIWLYPHSCQNTVAENNITKHHGDGIRIGESPYACSSNNTISNNFIAEAGEGVYIGGSPNNTISHNRIVACTSFGIRVDWSSDISTLQNNITDNGLSYPTGSGISIYNSTDCFVRKNRIISNKYGIEIYGTTGINLSQNDVFDNYRGVKCFNSSDNSVYHNSFVNNTKQVQIDQSTSVWDDGYPSGGNYWSDYNGTDANSGVYQNETGSDGIGDTPYVIDIGNRDNYPLVYPWSGCSTVKLPIKGGENTTIESNVTITNTLLTKNILHFDASGPSGSTGWVNVTFPMINRTDIKVFLNGTKLVPPPWPDITKNTTHYFIYFEFNLSSHEILIKFWWPYDVTGDDYCGIDDIVAVAEKFGTSPGKPDWHPVYDVNDDDWVGIDDIVATAEHFGQSP